MSRPVGVVFSAVALDRAIQALTDELSRLPARLPSLHDAPQRRRTAADVEDSSRW